MMARWGHGLIMRELLAPAVRNDRLIFLAARHVISIPSLAPVMQGISNFPFQSIT